MDKKRKKRKKNGSFVDGQRFRWNPWRIFALNDWETPRVCVCVHVMHCTSYSWMKMPRKSDDRGRSLVLKKYFPSRESSSPETDDLSTRDKKSEIVINVEKLQVLRLRSFTCFPRVLFRTEWGRGNWNLVGSYRGSIRMQSQPMKKYTHLTPLSREKRSPSLSRFDSCTRVKAISGEHLHRISREEWREGRNAC